MTIPDDDKIPDNLSELFHTDEIVGKILESNRITKSVVTILVASNTMLIGVVGFFGKQWYDSVNSHITKSNSGYERLVRVEEIQSSVINNQKEMLVEIRSIRMSVENAIIARQKRD